MIKLLEGLGHYFKPKEFVTNSLIFRLHTHFTTAFLFMCSIIVTATQFVGKPIECVHPKDGPVPRHVIETFCWITSTFTMPDAFNKQLGHHVPYPGIGNDHDGDKKYYTYYQWVCFVLFFQGCFFYLPQWMWKRFEGNLISTLASGMNHSLDSKENLERKRDTLMDYLTTHIRRHGLYVYRYFACELLCLINVIVQMYLIDRFFNGDFLAYGTRILAFFDMPQENRSDSMIYVFPKITKCTFHKYGSSGTIEKHDTLCVLPLNVVNEKIYIFIWFWFLALAGLLTCLLIYRAALVLVPSFRPRILHICTRKLPMETCKHVNKLNFGDWWILYNLSTNIDPIIYKDLLLELSKKLSSLFRD